MRLSSRVWQQVRELVLPAAREEQPLAKYRTAARLRLFFILPVLYGLTLLSMLRALRDSTQSYSTHTAVLLWALIAAAYVAVNVIALLSGNKTLHAALSMVCIAMELLTNEIVVFLTGAVASHALIFIIIAVAVYRVYFGYRQGLLSAVFGTGLHVLTVGLLLNGLLPNPPVQFSDSNAIATSGLAEASLAALAVGVLIAFFIINLGMNRLHRAQMQIVERWKRDLDSIEQYGKQVKGCADEAGVYAETLKAILYATPVRSVAILGRAGEGWQVMASMGVESPALTAILGSIKDMPHVGGELPIGDGGTAKAFCFPLDIAQGPEACLLACVGNADDRLRAMLTNIAHGAGGAISALRQLDDERTRAYIDPLTGLHNKRYFIERWQQWQRHAADSGGPFCVAMFDIDEFKQYNDTYGHLAGDDLLKLVAGAIAASLREGDVVARFGGEEFVVLFFRAGLQQGAQAAQRIRAAVEAIRGGFREVTVSGGLACYPLDSDDPEKLLECADRRLYDAKRAGKNRVCWEDSSGLTESRPE